MYSAKGKDCRNCPLQLRCVGSKKRVRTILITTGYESFLRAKRRHNRPDKKFKEAYSRHRWRVEGMHGEAKTLHGLRRAVRRGLANMTIQSYLTAAVINLKRLVAFAGLFITEIRLYLGRNQTTEHFEVIIKGFSANLEKNFALRKAG